MRAFIFIPKLCCWMYECPLEIICWWFIVELNEYWNEWVQTSFTSPALNWIIMRIVMRLKDHFCRVLQAFEAEATSVVLSGAENQQSYQEKLEENQKKLNYLVWFSCLFLFPAFRTYQLRINTKKPFTNFRSRWF